MTTDTKNDPRGLISEAYNIDGIAAAECRSIFLDWALGLPDDVDQHTALKSLVASHAQSNPDHPMSVVLNEGLIRFGTPRRRGGWRSRARD